MECTQPGKATNIIKEMRQLNMDILGCSEVRWPNSEHCSIGEH